MNIDENLISIEIQNVESLTKEQKTFNTLVGKIQFFKKNIALVNDFRDHQLGWFQKLHPSQLEEAETKKRLVLAMDASPFLHKLTRNQLQDFNEIVLALCDHLIAEFEMNDLEEIYQKYNQDNLTWEEAQKIELSNEKKEFSSKVSDWFGVDMDFDETNDFSSFEKEMDRVLNEIDKNNSNSSQKKEKTKKQLDKQKLALDAAKNATKKVRAVYLELVKNFHPDQEQDEIEKAKKTEIMQEIILAYEKNDLYLLLELQIKLLQNTKDGLDSISTESIQTYNKIFTEQLQNLEKEYKNLYKTYVAESPFFPLWGKINETKTVEKFVKKLIRKIQENTNHIKVAQKMVESNANDLKYFIEISRID